MSKQIDIYLDQISIFSLSKILIKLKISEINRVYYIDKTFTLGLEFFFRKIQFIDCNKFEESRIKIENKYLHLYLWQSLTDLSNKFLSKEYLLNNENFAENNNLNDVKYTEFLREKFLYQAYVPLKLYAYSKKFSKNNQTLFFIEKNALKPVFDSLSENFFYYYNIIFYVKIKKLNSMYFNFLYFRYFSFKIFLLKIIYLFLSRCIKGIFKSKNKSTQKKIGIDILQREINNKSITDLYWLKFSKIKKENICAISHVYWDNNSLNNLKEFNLQNLHFDSLPFFFKDFCKIFTLLPFLFFYLFRAKNFSGWKKFHQYLYLVQSIYYKSIYKMQNISVYFSMSDVDQDKLVKAQGLELNNTLFVQSHWSNFPTFKKINQKCCDIMFAWSPHFIKNNFSNFPFKKIYSLGFPSDHYFKDIEENSNKNYNDNSKFKISYMDNDFYNDIYFGKTISRKIMKMFIRLLEKHSNLILFLKPKSKLNFKNLKKKIPSLNKHIDNKRVKVFFGIGPNEKYNPAKLAKISNLVVGLGVSSAAAESSFSGTTSFHFDNLNLENENNFCKKNLNKIVFNKIENLEKEISNQIVSEKMSVAENKKLHGMLDSFQDGKTGLRTALIMDLIYEKYEKLDNLDSLLAKIDILINNNKILFKKNYL
jgi:hypothetical protein